MSLNYMSDSTDPIVLEDRALRSYSLACVKGLRALDYHKSAKLLCLIRGGYPPTRVVHNLASEFLEFTPELCDIPTSNFLKNRKHLVYALVERIFEDSYSRGDLKGAFTIDTAITGSSSRQFMDDFYSYFKEVVKRKGDREEVPEPFDYVFARFWHDREAEFNNTRAGPNVLPRNATDVRGRQHRVNMFLYNFGVRDLMSEDKPVLLGIDYPIDLKFNDQGGITGQKSEYIARVNEQIPIVVVGEDGARTTYRPTACQNTADMFVGLLGDYSRETISRLDFEFRRNKPLGNAWYPTLVNFCGTLKKGTR